MDSKKLDLFGKKLNNVVTLYHGSPYQDVAPTFGFGEDKHDYGRGFYLTPDKELAKEWAVSLPSTRIGWVHSYVLNLGGLEVIDFEKVQKHRALVWVAELLAHREPSFDHGDVPFYYDAYKAFLLQKFPSRTDTVDVACGWRADDSYFKIVEWLMRDELQLSDLEEALRLGNLGIQYCCKSIRAYDNLECVAPPMPVETELYRKRYQERDSKARRAIFEIRDRNRMISPKNKTTMGTIVFGR